MSGSRYKRERSARNGAESTAAMLGRVRRITGPMLWTGSGFAVALGVDKLAICPVLNRQLGSDLFGAFVWILGIMNLFGSVAANGFAILLLRDLSGFDREHANRALRSALLLAGAISVIVLAVASIGSFVFAEETVRAHALSLYAPLGLYALARSVEIVLVVILRIRRKFALMFLIRLLEGAVLLVNVAVAPSRNLWAVGGVYLASIVAALPLYVIWSGGAVGRGRWWDRPVARTLLAGWIGGALITFMEQSQVYLPRLVLGLGPDAGLVAVLYAGTSIGNMFLAPVGLLSGVVLSMLAGKVGFALSGRIGHEYLLLTGILGVVVGCSSYLVGRWVIRLLYPDLAPQTLGFYHWIAISNGLSSLALLFRLVAIEYLPLRRVTIVSTVIAAAQVACLVVLVPSWKAEGAAMALAASSLLAAFLWLMCFLQARHRAESPSRGASDIQPVN